MLVLFCFHYCSFVLCFEFSKVSKGKVCCFVLLAIQNPLGFHMNFRIFFLFLKKLPLDFDRDCADSVCHFG